MGRGEVWLINLDPTVGAEIKKTRPAVIVNDNAVGILPLPRSRKMRRVILHDTSSAFPPLAKGGQGGFMAVVRRASATKSPSVPLLQRGKAEVQPSWAAHGFIGALPSSRKRFTGCTSARRTTSRSWGGTAAEMKIRNVQPGNVHHPERSTVTLTSSVAVWSARRRAALRCGASSRRVAGRWSHGYRDPAA
jgi:hypothetical protein